ncbi:MAG: carboxylate--amine ligase, partial [Rhodococcus sp. (in: high G+C Gram-positive bacteria)]
LPAQVSADQLAAIGAYVRSVLSALEIGFGPTHTELVLTESGPRIIETHTRLAGDCIPQLVQDALGVNLTEYTVRQVLGERNLLHGLRAELADAATRPPRYEAIWFASSEMDCTLQSISGLESARLREGVREVELYRAAGARLESLRTSDSRFGHARAYADDPRVAVSRAREALDATEIRVLLPPLRSTSPI